MTEAVVSLKVKLISHTLNPEEVAGVAARGCWSKRTASEILAEGDRKKITTSLKKTVERGHTSVIEHASFTFSIEGISRACSHELVRHRIASYSQQSQRHIRLEKDYVTPQTIAEGQTARKLYDDHMGSAWEVYMKLLEMNIPPEDARFVLPNAARTNLVMTINARSLLNFFELRCCMHAQWEIRALAHRMLREVKKVAPLMFKNAGPPCIHGGICPEGDTSCKLYGEYVVACGAKSPGG
jgi:thymidylate synthase (FAD)